MSARSLEVSLNSVTATGCIGGGGQPTAISTAACGFTCLSADASWRINAAFVTK